MTPLNIIINPQDNSGNDHIVILLLFNHYTVIMESIQLTFALVYSKIGIVISILSQNMNIRKLLNI